MESRIIVLVFVLFFLLATILYGFSSETYQRIWQNLADRVGGPMTLRVILQPAMSIFAALKDGLADARLNRTPYLWTMVSKPGERRELLSEGLTSTAQTILLGVAIDLIYQYVVLKTFYPGEALIVAVTLAFLPYVLMRGPVARIARRLGVGRKSK